MALSGNGKKKNYRVILSGDLQAHLLVLQKEAKEAGIKDAFLSSFKTLIQRLKSNPDEVGELLYVQKGTALMVHVVIHPPLTMHFAINQDVPFVWVTKVVLLSRKGE